MKQQKDIVLRCSLTLPLAFCQVCISVCACPAQPSFSSPYRPHNPPCVYKTDVQTRCSCTEGKGLQTDLVYLSVCLVLQCLNILNYQQVKSCLSDVSVLSQIQIHEVWSCFLRPESHQALFLYCWIPSPVFTEEESSRIFRLYGKGCVM